MSSSRTPRPDKNSVTRQADSSAATSTPSRAPISHSMPLRKGRTFHCPPTPPSECSDPIVTAPSPPQRASTCPKALEEVVAGRERRMAALINSLDRGLADAGSTTSRRDLAVREEELPLPRMVLDAAASDTSSPTSGAGHHQDKGTVNRSRRIGNRLSTRAGHKHHSSDSGIGSTITGSVNPSSDCDEPINQFTAINSRRTRRAAPVSAATTDSSSSRGVTAITRSHSALNPSTQASQRSLSAHAVDQIRKRILAPILHRSFLKDFHPLVRDVPRRINEKEILCLRDLEKTLLLLAPERAKSPALYLNFCETSIQCIQATVDHIADRDQRRPSDRAYTTGYFLDLVQQVRHYADIMAASRQRQAAGASPNELDYSPNERVALHGGLSQTGQRAELVRVRNGRTISITTGQEIEEPMTEPRSIPLKRSSSQQSYDDEDSALRSMARRAGKRRLNSDAAKELAVQTCSDCGKEFKRPCDLTKHEKTHTRPWKCSDKLCKYYTQGWPTEKERDRHVNDKHSDAPAMYECHFKPCSYRSKRESNCKQHMEKSHNWTYIRSKNNGKARKQSSSTTPDDTINTPDSYTIATPISPESPVEARQHPYEPMYPLDAHHFSTPGEGAFGDHFSILHDPFNYGGLPLGEGSDAMDLHRDYHPDASGSPFTDPQAPTSHYTSPQQPHDEFEPSVEFNFNDLNSYHVQMPTPEQLQLLTPSQSTEQRPYHDFSTRSARLPERDHDHVHLSPGAQANAMLYTPHTETSDSVDEGFVDLIPTAGRPTQDFSLFSSGESSTMDSVEDMFQPIDAISSQGLSQQFPEMVNDYMNWETHTE